MGAQRTIYMDHSATTFVKPEVLAGHDSLLHETFWEPLLNIQHRP